MFHNEKTQLMSSSSSEGKDLSFLMSKSTVVISLSDGDIRGNIVWDNVEEIRLRTFKGSNSQCPICLEKPVLPRITFCGHIFCWSCVLEYGRTCHGQLNCPVCKTDFYHLSVKPVVLVEKNKFEIGEEIRMKYMQKFLFSKLVVPLDCGKEDDGIPLVANYVERFEERFQKILLAKRSYLKSINCREIRDLLKVKQKGDCSTTTIIDIESSLLRREKELECLINKKIETKRPLKIKRNVSKFYQSADGQNIFLHVKSLQCILVQYGDQTMPYDISGTIEHIDIYTMNDELRKRFRFLDHLPTHTEFWMVTLNNIREIQAEGNPPFLQDSDDEKSYIENFDMFSAPLQSKVFEYNNNSEFPIFWDDTEATLGQYYDVASMNHMNFEDTNWNNEESSQYKNREFQGSIQDFEYAQSFEDNTPLVYSSPDVSWGYQLEGVPQQDEEYMANPDLNEMFKQFNLTSYQPTEVTQDFQEF